MQRYDKSELSLAVISRTYIDKKVTNSQIIRSVVSALYLPLGMLS